MFVRFCFHRSNFVVLCVFCQFLLVLLSFLSSDCSHFSLQKALRYAKLYLSQAGGDTTDSYKGIEFHTLGEELMDNRTTVIIADNAEEFCTGLTNALRSSDGFQVLGTANDGEQAIRMVSERKPDILVLDLMLAKKDGLAVLKAISAMEHRPATLATSRFITDYVASSAANLGVRYLMVKPFGGDPWWRKSAQVPAPAGQRQQHRIHGHQHHPRDRCPGTHQGLPISAGGHYHRRQ